MDMAAFLPPWSGTLGLEIRLGPDNAPDQSGTSHGKQEIDTLYIVEMYREV
jgi:hypothetical protein